MVQKVDRHPVRWPRMKVRGRRRRALAAQRFEQVIYLPFAQAVMVDSSVTFMARAEGGAEPTYAIKVSRVFDGLGRPVRRVR